MKYIFHRKIIDQIEKGLEVEKAENKYVTGAAVKVKVLEERDQIAAINAYEELNHTEVVTRDIYQVWNEDLGYNIMYSSQFIINYDLKIRSEREAKVCKKN